jgi:uncharacterized membrane protein
MQDVDTRADREADTRLLHRVVFFTDAVFAIVMTLLVLDLRPPVAADEAALGAGLDALAPTFDAFLMSFALTGVFWFAHLSTTRRLVKFDALAAVLNMLFLLPVTLMPFASRLLGAGFSSPLTWKVYSATLVAASISNILLVLAVNRGGGRLVGGISGRYLTNRVIRASAPGVAFALGFWGADHGLLIVPKLCWVAIPLMLGLARLVGGGAPPRKTSEPSADVEAA